MNIKMDLSMLCRSCMKEVATWEKDNFDQASVDMFCFCTNVKITDDDKLPKQFCYDCFIKIESSFTFIKEAQKVNVTLKNIVSRTQTSVIVETDTQLRTLMSLCQEKTTEISQIPSNSNTDCEDYSINTEEIVLERNENELSQQDLVTEKVNKIDEILQENISNATNDDTSLHRNKTDDVLIKSTIVEENIRCAICDKKFSFKAWLTRHMHKVHGGNKYSCDQCDKTFSVQHQLRAHSASHSECRAHACPSCGARFKRKKQLAAHAHTHTDARPYHCDHCGKQFKSKSSLKGHMAVHSGSKPHLCSVCGASFTYACNLKVHQSSHSIARPLACPRCEYRARTRAALARHVARHTSDRRRPCHVCRKTFTDASSLTRHMRTHTGELPFKCPSCSRAFADSWKRKAHLMSHHKMALHDIPRLPRDPYVT